MRPRKAGSCETLLLRSWEINLHPDVAFFNDLFIALEILQSKRVAVKKTFAQKG